MALLRLLNSLDSYGVLLNDRDSHALLLALKTVAGGLVALDPVLLSAGLLPVQPLDSALPTDDLTPREDDVLQLLAQGLTNKAIAHRLGITDHTVKFHVTAIISKFQAQSRTDAVVRATRAGLVIL
jgi:DNA-binding NarL/FixJ family response regulator